MQTRERVMWRQQDKRVRWWVKDRWACEAEADGGEESTEDGELELCDPKGAPPIDVKLGIPVIADRSLSSCARRYVYGRPGVRWASQFLRPNSS